MPNANTALVERIFGRAGGDFGTIDGALYLASMGAEVRYTIIGSTSFSVVAQWRDEVLGRILGPLMAELEGGIELAVDTVFGKGDLVAMQVRGQARTKRGARYDNSYCFVFRFRDGHIAEITEYLDTELVRSALG